MEKSLTKISRKVLLNLAGSGILKFTRSTQGYFRILEPRDGTWEQLGKKSLYSALAALYKQKLISIVETLDGITEIAILDEGRSVAEKEIAYDSIPRPSRWDKKWRLVFFDIPEEKKNSREAFRYHLKKLGFTEFHKSTFIFPFPCTKEIETLAARFGIKPNIRLATAESVDSEFEFKKHFNLL
ncbi:MAG: hypothetical protein HYW90_03950 [Candidatus Sungbacteria bacterium]|nr:hypothetical protein [Candidatus Sungbacteria bacterium]